MDKLSQAHIDELEVVEAIYPEFLQTVSERPNALIRLEIPVNCTQQTFTIQQELYANVPKASSSPITLDLSHLPPLILEILLTPAYPEHSPPIIRSLSSRYSWVARKSSQELKYHLSQMWTEGDSVLCNWVDYIYSGEFLDTLLPSRHISHRSPLTLAGLLRNHQAEALNEAFVSQSFPCPICLSSLKGSKCITLECAHVACRSCLSDFWGFCITEGDIGRVQCPFPECIKAGNEAGEEDVRRIITDDLLKRWKWLRAKRAVDLDPTIVLCPLDFCQSPVPGPPKTGDDTESNWDRLRTCPSCGYSFCSLCRRTWHGPHTPCVSSATAEFILEYMTLPDDAPKKAQIETRYGKANMKRLVAKYLEEKALKEWLSESTTPCPGCSVNVEKSMGCNHMTCSKCKQHFCYRCGTKISAANPYAHFSSPGQPCFNKLFDFAATQEEWVPMDIFNGL
ncbi:hypothetical protein SISNIDRAFT_477911 [Sistotremastrum niveocremeum HHB9708]|uniref:RBR-type E3 ubiquitin transferase n=2 Tax=Sistotremastraceae TaxID=3402574 RepID=A0A164XNI8_9AGAM|nr:hypothetical protein SISNIDRAFT_477911 [Sistotremastrum niveocremeum HHB9708]KZT44516.1 hypothetical protein SISSUDRAFT_1012727 [Sistotremastrum suecicum HHB10207 ss-3]